MTKKDPSILCAPDLFAFSQVENVHWGRPGITEQTPEGSEERTFVFQGQDGCPLAVLRLQADTIVDVAVARPSPYPEDIVEALLARAMQEGARSIDLYTGNPLQRLARKAGLQCR